MPEHFLISYLLPLGSIIYYSQSSKIQMVSQVCKDRCQLLEIRGEIFVLQSGRYDNLQNCDFTDLFNNSQFYI